MGLDGKIIDEFRLAIEKDYVRQFWIGAKRGKVIMNKLKFTIILCTIVVIGSGLYSCYNYTPFIPKWMGSGVAGGYGKITWVSRKEIKDEDKKNKKQIKAVKKIVDNAKNELEKFYGTKVNKFFLVNSNDFIVNVNDSYNYIDDNYDNAYFFVYLEKYPNLRIYTRYQENLDIGYANSGQLRFEGDY